MKANASRRSGSAEPDPEVSNLVSELAADDESARAHAVYRLVRMGRRASMALTRALAQGSDDVRWEAAVALSRIADSSTAFPLVGALDDVDVGVRWLAAEALVAIGDSALTVLLEALVRDADSVFLREGARHVFLARSRGPLGPTIEPVLRALENAAPETAVPPAAYKALVELRGDANRLQSSSA